MKQSGKLNEAKMLFASGELEKCIAVFTEAEQEGSDVVDVCLSRGAAQVALGNYKEAKEDFTLVLDVDADNERAHYFRGVALVGQGKYEEAVLDLTQSLAKNNNRGIAHLLRGLVYAELGQEKDALLDINSASVFTDAELQSFKNLFGDIPPPFQSAKELLARENAPWKNVISQESANRLRNFLE